MHRINTYRISIHGEDVFIRRQIDMSITFRISLTPKATWARRHRHNWGNATIEFASLGFRSISWPWRRPCTYEKFQSSRRWIRTKTILTERPSWIRIDLITPIVQEASRIKAAPGPTAHWESNFCLENGCVMKMTTYPTFSRGTRETTLAGRVVCWSAK